MTKQFSIFNNGQWDIKANRLDSGRLVLSVESIKTGHCDWPIRYDDGKVVWDYPERIPTYVKNITRSILNPAKRKDKWVRLSDMQGII